MAWLADKAKNLFSRGKGAQISGTAEVRPVIGTKATYHEMKLSMPLESGKTGLLGKTLEQVRKDPDACVVLEKSGLPSLDDDQLAGESVADSIRQKGQGLSDEEHRLLTVYVLLGSGDTKFSGGYFASAESAYREAQKMAAGTKDKSLQAICQAGIAAAMAIQEKHEQALKLLEDAMRHKPDIAVAWYNKGVILLVLGRYKEALPCFDEILQSDPEFAEAWYNRGVALANLESYKEALASFDNALDRSVHDTDAWLGKGVSLLMDARYEEALASFEEALRDRPAFAEAWLGRGLALMMLTKHQEALSSYEEAMSRSLA
jgi:tetratricopeptide (TPR) repeat protein